MSNKAKILIIDNSKDFTGAFKSMMLYAKELENEFEFIWCIPKNSLIKQHLSKSPFLFHEIPFLEISKSLKTLLYPFQLLINTSKIARIVRQKQISIVHVNDMYNLCGILLKVFTKIKVVYHARLLPTSYIGKFFFLYRSIISRYSNKVLVVSSAVEEHFANKEKVIVLNDWIQIPELNKKGEITNPRLNILYVGALMKGKGQMEAIQVAKILKHENQKFNLKFVGLFDQKDSFYLSLKKEIDEFDLNDSIEFIGYMDDLTEEYLNADILLNLSFSESFSMVILEASLHELPVISYNSGGPSDIIVNNQTGYLIKTGDINSVSNLLIDLNANRHLLNELGEKARKNSVEKFDGKKLSNRLLNLYKKMI